MKTTHSFGIDFLIRRCKENKKRALIYARITVDEERKEISIKEQIDAGDWDCKKEMVKGKSIEVKAVNEYIDDVRFRIKEKYRLLQDEGALITAETVKQAYLGTHTILKGHKLMELMDYYYKISEGKMKPGGFKNVKTTIEYVRRFMRSQYPGAISTFRSCRCNWLRILSTMYAIIRLRNMIGVREMGWLNTFNVSRRSSTGR